MRFPFGMRSGGCRPNQRLRICLEYPLGAWLLVIMLALPVERIQCQTLKEVGVGSPSEFSQDRGATMLATFIRAITLTLGQGSGSDSHRSRPFDPPPGAESGSLSRLPVESAESQRFSFSRDSELRPDNRRRLPNIHSEQSLPIPSSRESSSHHSQRLSFPDSLHDDRLSPAFPFSRLSSRPRAEEPLATANPLAGPSFHFQRRPAQSTLPPPERFPSQGRVSGRLERPRPPSDIPDPRPIHHRGSVRFSGGTSSWPASRLTPAAETTTALSRELQVDPLPAASPLSKPPNDISQTKSESNSPTTTANSTIDDYYYYDDGEYEDTTSPSSVTPKTSQPSEMTKVQPEVVQTSAGLEDDYGDYTGAGGEPPGEQSHQASSSENDAHTAHKIQSKQKISSPMTDFGNELTSDSRSGSRNGTRNWKSSAGSSLLPTVSPIVVTTAALPGQLDDTDNSLEPTGLPTSQHAVSITPPPGTFDQFNSSIQDQQEDHGLHDYEYGEYGEVSALDHPHSHEDISGTGTKGGSAGGGVDGPAAEIVASGEVSAFDQGVQESKTTTKAAPPRETSVKTDGATTVSHSPIQQKLSTPASHSGEVSYIIGDEEEGRRTHEATFTGGNELTSTTPQPSTTTTVPPTTTRHRVNPLTSSSPRVFVATLPSGFNPPAPTSRSRFIFPVTQRFTPTTESTSPSPLVHAVQFRSDEIKEKSAEFETTTSRQIGDSIVVSADDNTDSSFLEKSEETTTVHTTQATPTTTSRVFKPLFPSPFLLKEAKTPTRSTSPRANIKEPSVTSETHVSLAATTQRPSPTNKFIITVSSETTTDAGGSVVSSHSQHVGETKKESLQLSPELDHSPKTADSEQEQETQRGSSVEVAEVDAGIKEAVENTESDTDDGRVNAFEGEVSHDHFSVEKEATASGTTTSTPAPQTLPPTTTVTPPTTRFHELFATKLTTEATTSLPKFTSKTISPSSPVRSPSRHRGTVTTDIPLAPGVTTEEPVTLVLIPFKSRGVSRGRSSIGRLFDQLFEKQKSSRAPITTSLPPTTASTNFTVDANSTLTVVVVDDETNNGTVGGNATDSSESIESTTSKQRLGFGLTRKPYPFPRTGSRTTRPPIKIATRKTSDILHKQRPTLRPLVRKISPERPAGEPYPSDPDSKNKQTDEEPPTDAPTPRAVTTLSPYFLWGRSVEVACTMKITDGAEWDNMLEDHKSDEYQKLANEVQEELTSLYKRSDFASRFKGIQIEGFSKGSVLVDYTLYLTESDNGVDPGHLWESLVKALDNGTNVGPFEVDAGAMSFDVVRKITPPPEIAAEEAGLLPHWAIAVLVIGLASLLFLIVLCVVMTRNRRGAKRKYGTPLKEDSSPDRGKSWDKAAYDNLGASESLYNGQGTWDAKKPKQRAFNYNIYGMSPTTPGNLYAPHPAHTMSAAYGYGGSLPGPGPMGNAAIYGGSHSTAGIYSGASTGRGYVSSIYDRFGASSSSGPVSGSGTGHGDSLEFGPDDPEEGEGSLGGKYYDSWRSDWSRNARIPKAKDYDTSF